jgi:glyoxylase-like metal-dependent hydrolase (beta-lactamase superfamily II)
MGWYDTGHPHPEYKKMKRVLLILITLLLVPSITSAAVYTPKAEQVVDNVYAIIGPLDQRSEENNGLNDNLGFIVTPDGVILIDSGASRMGAELIAKAITKVTPLPVRWVVNTGGQDHRWLGNDYFAGQGAEIIAMKRTAATQKAYASQQMEGLKRFLGKNLEGTVPMPATKQLEGDEAKIKLGGVELDILYTDTHYPGDAMVWLPQKRVVFTGDLVYVDRAFVVLPWSSVKNGQKAFARMVALQPEYIVPGHGGVTDLAKAQRECGDYYDFLNNVIGAAATEMEPMEEVIKKYTSLPAFEHLKHFKELHPVNMNRTYLEYEAF